MPDAANYRGRLAPSPTGYLHRGHAATFWIAQERCRQRGGTLILRVEDLDRERCREEFADSLLDDLLWAGLTWQEGPDVGGSTGPYRQSERLSLYASAWRQLAEAGAIYPCRCTRRDVENALSAPHEGEAIYSGVCRPAEVLPVVGGVCDVMNWRFRVNPGEMVTFDDGCAGPQFFRAGRDFGDFIVWRKDDLPSYQLAVVVDDAAMGITEVVRGADLLVATAQQILLYRALGRMPPAFFHCPLVTDSTGQRLAKRAGAHSLRAMRTDGVDPAVLRPSMPPVAAARVSA